MICVGIQCNIVGVLTGELCFNMVQNISRRRVLVFGNDTRAFLAIVRSLGRRGIEVHAVPFNAQAPALKSRYIAKIHHLSPSDETSRWIDGLKDLVSRYEFDLLIPCCDRSILSLDAHSGQLGQVKMALPGKAVLKGLFDKYETRKLAIKTNTPITAGRLLTKKDTASGLIEEFSLPFLLKARRSYQLQELENRGEVHIIRSSGQIEKLLADITDRDEFLVEEFFAGSGAGISVLASKGRVLCAFAHRRLMEPRNGGGSSLRASEKIDPARLESCKKIATLTGLDGVAMFEFRVDEPSGDWVLIEVNARFWGSLPLPVALGVDFPFFLYEMIVKGKNTSQVGYPNNVNARNFAINAYDVLLRDTRLNFVSVKSLLRDLFDLVFHPVLLLSGHEKSDTFQSDDLRPAFFELLYIPQMIFARLARRRWEPVKNSINKYSIWQKHDA